VRPVTRAPLHPRAIGVLPMTNPTCSSCGADVAIVDLSESNHDDFRASAGT
jgi:hypothetical protein